MAQGKDIKEAMALLREQFIAHLPAKLADIAQNAVGLEQADPDSAELRTLHRLLHGLIGSAGSIGLRSLSEAARRAELILDRLRKAGHEDERRPMADELAAALGQLDNLAHSIPHQPAPGLQMPIMHDHPAPQAEPLIFLVEDEPEQGERLTQLLKRMGYRVWLFSTLQMFAAAIQANASPAVIIMDMVFAEGELAGAEYIQRLRQTYQGVFPPVLFLSVRNDLDARLSAYRVGSVHYLNKPVDHLRLLRLLDEISLRVPKEPYRVLMVDDDPLVLEVQAAVLRAAGMVVTALTEPRQTLEQIEAFDPEVLILDFHMPGISGPELAALLREEERYLQLPILFLSAEIDEDWQLQALSLGGDDFLLKPIVPEHLVIRVLAQARRAREYQGSQRQLRQMLYEREREHLALNQHAIVVVVDGAAKIIYVNDLFCDISGYSREELLGQNPRLLKSDQHPESFYREMWATITAGRMWRGEICNIRKDGSYYWVESTITPFLDSEAKPYQYVSIHTDITHVKVAEQALAENAERFNATLESTKDGILAVGVGGEVLFMNRQLRRMWSMPETLAHDGANDEALLEHALTQLVDPQGFMQQVRALYRSQEESEGLIELIDGRVLESHSKPLQHGGHLFGRVWSFHDITERLRAERAAEAAGERLRRGQLYANIGTWEWSIVTGELFWTERIPPLFGHPEGDLETSYDNFMAAVHPADRQAVLDAVDACIERDVPYEIEHRVVWPDGSVRWLLERGAVQRDAEGKATCMLGMVQDIDDRKRVELALVAAREEADRANQAKSEFLSSMSHELRTPMNAILGFGQLMQYDDSLPDEHLDSVKEILNAGQHLLELINEVLDLAKVESGSIDLSLEAVELGPVVEECLSLLSTLADPRGIRLGHQGLQAMAVRADRIRLKQVLLNLLSNAIKYNREGGSVQLDVQPAGADRLRIEVRDTGPGIPANRLVELFQPFSRLDAQASEIEGSGIGLTITRRLVEMMGGTVDVQSEVGVGSTFWIELPLETPVTASDAPPDSLPAGAVDTGRDAAGHKTILYIEDNPANLRLMAQILGHVPQIRLLTAHTPVLGIELALARRPELILLDINLPGMDGYQVLKVIQAEASLKDTLVIALTANAMPRDIERGRAAGFVHYLTKPLDVEQFLEIVKRCLKRGTP